MLANFQGPVLIERAHFLINSDRTSLNEKKQCAVLAINYLVSLRYTKSPHWRELLSASGLLTIETVDAASHGNSKLSVLCKAIAQEYTEAINILETTPNAGSEYYRNLEIIAQLLILSNNFKALEELEYRLNDCHSGNTIKEELEAMKRTKLLICCGFYMQGRFLDFCKSFFKFEKSDPDFWSALLTKAANSFLTAEELMHMATVSVIVSTPLDNYGDFLSVENLTRFRKECPMLVTCLKLLSNTCFGRFLNLWDNEIDDQCCRSPFLSRGWESARFMVRNKIYFFYLRISNKLTVSYLSRTLHIEEALVKQEVRQLLRDLHLNFEIEGDTIYYRSNPFLSNVVGKLEHNREVISRTLESRTLNTKQLKDSLQEAIIENSGSQRDRKGSSGREATDRMAFRYGLDEEMDVDEINDISDVESASFISGGQ